MTAETKRDRTEAERSKENKLAGSYELKKQRILA